MKRDSDPQAARVLLAALRTPIDVPPPDDAERERMRPELERWITALPKARARAQRASWPRMVWQRVLDGQRGTVADLSARFDVSNAAATESAAERRWLTLPRVAGWALATCCALAVTGYFFQRADAPSAASVSAPADAPAAARPAELARGPQADGTARDHGAQSSASLIAGSLYASDEHEVALGSRLGGSTSAAAQAVSDNQLVHTRNSQSALLLIASGVQATLSPDTVARLPASSDQPELGLVHGQVSLDVPPMPKGASFVVQTPDTRVTVHGTRFTVSYPGAQGSSCVRVTEGRVGVKSASTDVMLGPGEAVGCDDAPSSNARNRRAKPAADEQSTLALQNQLLQQALVKEQQGDEVGARRALRTLLSKYPESPFAPEARRALTRLNAP